MKKKRLSCNKSVNNKLTFFHCHHCVNYSTLEYSKSFGDCLMRYLCPCCTSRTYWKVTGQGVFYRKVPPCGGNFGTGKFFITSIYVLLINLNFIFLKKIFPLKILVFDLRKDLMFIHTTQ